MRGGHELSNSMCKIARNTDGHGGECKDGQINGGMRVCWVKLDGMSLDWSRDAARHSGVTI